ncbi:MAG: VWA domain-containing protein [Actinobacteria bacterium]|nr:MAG: VWA domain-containing protein [Actinomycetota bacterium]
MLRKTVGGIASTALVAGLATTGIIAAAPASAAVPSPAPNPTLQGCGIPVTLVLDASSSIGDSEQLQVKQAANAFLDGLDNTNSTARVVQFSGTSAQIIARQPISGQGLTDLKDAIDTKYHDEVGYTYPGTNWESAFWRTYQPAPDGETPQLTNGLVVFITDGDPTRYGTTTSNSGQSTQFYTDAAQTYSDLLKNAPRSNRIVAVGVGLNNAGAQDRLKQVSGPTVVTSVPANATINDFDVLIPDNFNNLEDALKGVATSLCGGAITIEKLTDEGPNGTYVPAAGWNISAEVKGATNPEDFEWINPVNNTDEQVSGVTAGEPANQNDPPKGTVQFQYQPKSSWNSKNPSIRITETLDAKFDPRTTPFGFRCEFPGSSRQAVEGTLTASGSNAYFDVVNVTADQRLSCKIYNTHKRTSLRLQKVVEGGGTTAAQWTMTAEGPGNAPSYSKPGDHQGFEPVWANTEYTLNELAPQGEAGNYVAGDWTCDKGVVPAGDKITIPTGTTDVTCTITNSRKGELVVKKITDPKGASQEFEFTPGGWNNNGTFPLKDGEEKSSGKIAPGNYSVGENVPSGWTLSDITCDAGDPARDGDAVYVNVPAGVKVTCTFENTKDTAMLRLKKVVSGGSATPADWLLSAKADAPFDTKNIVDIPGSNDAYAEVYADELYTLSESEGPAGYNPGPFWECVSDNEETRALPAVSQDGNQVRLAPGEMATCTITNYRQSAELKLVKEVDGADPNSWTLTAKASAPDDDKNISTPGGSGQFEQVYAGTQYTLAETGPGGYSASDWVCLPSGEEPVPGVVEGQLNDGDKITLKAGQRVTCTIVNTRDLGSLTITKEFNPQSSGFTGTFDITYTCVDGANPVKSGTVSLADGQSETITGLPTGTSCTVDEPTLPAPPAGWQFNLPTYSPSNTVTVTGKDQTVSVTVVNSIAQVNPVVVKKVCPIDVTLNKPVPKKVGNKILTKKITTKKSSCVLVKPVVLCRPLASTTAGETAFCDTKVTKKGRITVKTQGYDAVRVTVIVRSKPKPGFEDRWKPNTWRKSWILR